MNYKIKIVSKNKSNVVIYAIEIIKDIQNEHNNIDVIILGESKTLINIDSGYEDNKLFKYVKLVLVCILLFTGAALSIIYFHEDVNMQGTFESINLIITGNKTKNLRFLQIPYSFGLGIGMFIFFNHISKDNNQVPSPLDIEMHTYQEDIDDYLIETFKDRE